MGKPDNTKCVVLGASVAIKSRIVDRLSQGLLQRRAETLLAATKQLDEINPADLHARLKECRSIRVTLPVSIRQTPGIVYSTEDNFTVNAVLRLPDDTPEQTQARQLARQQGVQEVDARLSERETEIRARIQALVSRLKTEHDRKVFVVALKWRLNELRGGKYYFQALANFVADDGTGVTPNWPHAPKSYLDCLGRRELENLVYKERDRVLAETLGNRKSSAEKKKSALHKTA